MPTWSQISDDVMVAMGYTHDDALRSREAILYNAAIIVNKLKNQQLKKHAKTGDEIANQDMLSIRTVPLLHRNVENDVVNNWDACYFDLPTPVMDLDYGGGMAFVRYLRNDIPKGCPPAISRTPFTQTSLAALYNLYNSTYQRPQSKRPYFARATENSIDRVYVFGVPEYVNNLLVGLYEAASYMNIDPDAEVDLPAHLFPTLKKMMLEMESWLLQLPQQRLQNDGRDFQPDQTVPTRPIISVNDPSQFDTD